MTDKENFNIIIQTKFRDADKKIPPADFTYEDISKVGFEKYVGSDRGTIKIFFYSRGKSGNNKPYSLDGRTFTEYIQFDELLEKCRADVENIFDVSEKVEAVNTNPFSSADATKKKENSFGS